MVSAMTLARTLTSALAFASVTALCARAAHAQDGSEPPPAPPSAPPPAPASPPATAAAQIELPQQEDTSPLRVCNGMHRDRTRDHETATGLSIGCPDAVGLRGSETQVIGANATEGAGLMFYAGGGEFGHHDRYWSSRDTYELALGGGAAGLEGMLSGSLAYGFRAPLLPDEGPVVRAAASAYIMGDDAFYASLLELPQVQLGWQWSHGHAVIELAATTGVVLTGRFRAGDAETRQMGHGFAFGGHASLQVPWVRLSVEAEQLPSYDSLPAPVDVVRGTLCAVAYPMAICADGRAERTRAMEGTSEPLVTAAYAGITLGFTGSN
jgi:hypothetical protein